jgi:DnaD/phage-associated family protein
MSIKIMEQVWKLDLPQNEKLVLLAYADHADEHGRSVFPSIKYLMQKTGYSERSVQVITRKLQSRSLLKLEGRGPYGTNLWHVTLPEMGQPQPPEPNEAGDAKTAPAESAPAESAPVQPAAPGGAVGCAPGVQWAAPEPSLTASQPSESTTTTTAVETGAIFKAYQNEIGLITPLIAEKIGGWLDDPLCPRDWVLDAIHEAARQNKRNWAYCEAILKRWQTEGKQERVKPGETYRYRSHTRKREMRQPVLTAEQLRQARAQAEKELLA